MFCPRCKIEVSEDMNYCPGCGMKLERCPICHQPIVSGAHYCSHCGAHLMQQNNQLGGYYEPIHSSENQQEWNDSTFKDIQVTKKVNKKVIIISVMALIIVTVVSYVYLQKGPLLTQVLDKEQDTLQLESMTIKGENSFSTLTSNINQGGEVYQYGDKIYMCDDQGNIVCMDRNLENRNVLIQGKCQYLNIVDDTIYYTNKDMNICSASVNGENQQVLLNVKAYYVVVIDQDIYYQMDNDSEKLYVYHMDTKENIKLNDRATYNINVVDDMIYYTSVDGIYKISIDGQGEEKILSDNGIGLVYQNKKLYYLKNDGYICSYDLEKKSIKEITDNGYVFIGINDDYLFYLSSRSQVICYNLKTGESKSIYNGFITGGYIMGDKLILISSSSYNRDESSQYKIIMEFDGSNQQRLFTDMSGSFV